MTPDFTRVPRKIEARADEVEGMHADPREELNGLQEIRDLALLLSLGNVYLCEEVFLKKIGRAIALSRKRLGKEILSLKERFPGKFAVAVDTDRSLEELQAHAVHMQQLEKGISDRCMAGELGRELERLVAELAAAVQVLRSKVGVDPPAYSRRSYIPDFLGWINALGTLIRRLWKLLLKVAIIVLVIVIGPLVYLFLTMEETGTYEKEVRQSRAHIQAQREIIASIERKREDINLKISSLRRPDLSRQERIDIMDLMVKIHGLDAERNKIEVDIADHENMIKHKEAKIDEIRNKSFFKRLFRF